MRVRGSEGAQRKVRVNVAVLRTERSAARRCCLCANELQAQRGVSVCAKRTGGVDAAAGEGVATPDAQAGAAAQSGAAAGKRRPKRMLGLAMVKAVERDPSLSLVDALLAHFEWAKELDVKATEAMRAFEAALQSGGLSLRAHRVCTAAYQRVTYKRRRAAGQTDMRGAFMVAAVQRNPNMTLLDALLSESSVADGLSSEDVQALRKAESKLLSDASLDQCKRASSLYNTAAHRSAAAPLRRTAGAASAQCAATCLV